MITEGTWRAESFIVNTLKICGLAEAPFLPAAMNACLKSLGNAGRRGLLALGAGRFVQQFVCLSTIHGSILLAIVKICRGWEPELPHLRGLQLEVRFRGSFEVDRALRWLPNGIRAVSEEKGSQAAHFLSPDGLRYPAAGRPKPEVSILLQTPQPSVLYKP